MAPTCSKRGAQSHGRPRASAGARRPHARFPVARARRIGLEGRAGSDIVTPRTKPPANPHESTGDDACDVVSTIHSRRPNLIPAMLGGSEETTTGVIRLRAMEADGVLAYPVIAANDADTKHLFDNRYGTGQRLVATTPPPSSRSQAAAWERTICEAPASRMSRSTASEIHGSQAGAWEPDREEGADRNPLDLPVPTG